jgi:hypothetical protein
MPLNERVPMAEGVAKPISLTPCTKQNVRRPQEMGHGFNPIKIV